MNTCKMILALMLCMALFITAAEADSARESTGSCLLFPIYDCTPGNLSIITLTNVGDQDVWVRLVWVDGQTCSPSDTWLDLTRRDTFTFLSSSMNPFSDQGFLYVYVVQDEFSELEVDYDYLVGQELLISLWEYGSMGCFSLNALVFQALNPVADGNIHIDGTEFSAAPKAVYFPRFLGQPETGNTGFFESKVVLINLTGGKFFNASVGVMIYNDNELPFSSTFECDCFEYVPLNEVCPATKNMFLSSSNHDPDEPLGFSSVVETGWIKFIGMDAYNFIEVIEDPSILAVLVEKMGLWGFGADLPLQVEGNPSDYDRVMLWSTRPDGN